MSFLNKKITLTSIRKFCKKVRDGNKAQKIIFTIWFVLGLAAGSYVSFLEAHHYSFRLFSDNKLVFSEGSFLFGLFLYIPLFLFILSLPAFIFWKVWQSKDENK